MGITPDFSRHKKESKYWFLKVAKEKNINYQIIYRQWKKGGWQFF